MPRANLRIYYGPSDEENAEFPDRPGSGIEHSTETVEVMLCDVVTILADALKSGRVWLRDFADDRVTISRDLFEVLQEYQRLRRPAA
jgi:hypothetical protein